MNDFRLPSPPKSKPCCQPTEPAPSCCSAPPAPADSCCSSPSDSSSSSCCSPKKRVDWILWGSLILLAAGLLGHSLISGGPEWWHRFAHASADFLSKSWWGLLAGIVAVGIVGQMPRELITGLLGKGGTFSGILRAVLAGTLLDLCNHGVLMIGAQLYRKGASLGQTLAFLISSPWNSLSLTLILAAMIGWKWVLIFIALSALIGVITGWLADRLVRSGHLPHNPNTVGIPETLAFRPVIQESLRRLKPNRANLTSILRHGMHESRMILRWIFFGVVLAALIRAFVPDTTFSQYFGPTLVGLLLTLVATTLIEVCSEGSSPIAADLITRAAAPGNAFTFLMAGAATDYTEVMVLKEITGSWKAALILPLLSVPQVVIIGWLLNS